MELSVTLPAGVAREAEALGLLQPEALERVMREAVRRRRQEQLFAAADKLAADETPALTEAEVNAEIQAARAERRAGRASSG